MTRKRVGQGLIEAFSEPCEHCGGRGVKVQMEPVDLKTKGGGSTDGPARRKRGGKAKADAADPAKADADDAVPSAEEPSAPETAEAVPEPVA